jgi:hypothetical protein
MTPQTVLRVDLPAGVIILVDGQRVPITQYLGAPDEAPDDDEPVVSFDWVKTVVAGPDADGEWHSVQVLDDDREARL